MAPPEEDDVPDEFLCAATGRPLYMPVVTTHGVSYSYAALFGMFMEAKGLPTCFVTGATISFFPSVCLPLHHYLMDQYKPVMKVRRQQDQKELVESFGFDMPRVEEAPDAAVNHTLRDEVECSVVEGLAYAPCVLSSGTIVSACAVPEAGFDRDPDVTVGCALYGQRPRPSPALEKLMLLAYGEEYKARALQLLKGAYQISGRFADGSWAEDLVSPCAHVFWGYGCDGCGIWPIRDEAWEDAQCGGKPGFHVCGRCYKLGFHRRVVTGKFNQDRLPRNQMVKMPEVDFM